jgi:hypothetical protein
LAEAHPDIDQQKEPVVQKASTVVNKNKKKAAKKPRKIQIDGEDLDKILAKTTKKE